MNDEARRIFLFCRKHARILLPGLIWLFSTMLFAQPSGEEVWAGYLTVRGSRDTFRLSLHLTHQGGLISGYSVSLAPDGRRGRFALAGSLEGSVLLLQELEQSEPRNERWCMKYFQLAFAEGEPCRIKGIWQAEGCPGGEVCLNPAGTVSLAPEHVPDTFRLEGLWTGHLSQADREYGFYFEMDLQEDAHGASSIVSEANGGRAYHDLGWRFDASDSVLHFQESRVVQRTLPDWKWCIKSGDLQLRREAYRYTLTGKWSGYIEGFTQKSGPCAPGTLYLEKAIPLRDTALERALQSPGNPALEARPVKLARSLEVSGPKIKLRLWDNGTEDGDVISLYLNGKRIAHNFKVTKAKASMHVNLERSHNILVLYAEDIGSITPNTVALSIDDGKKEQVLVLSADLRESGAVLIRYFSLE